MTYRVNSVPETYQDRMTHTRRQQEEALRQFVEGQRAEPVVVSGKPRTRAQKRAQRARARGISE
jgi:hypothetical protein